MRNFVNKFLKGNNEPANDDGDKDQEPTALWDDSQDITLPGGPLEPPGTEQEDSTAGGEEQVVIGGNNSNELTIPGKLSMEDTAVGLKAVDRRQLLAKAHHLQAAYRCDVGMVRKRNEDSVFVFTAGAGGEEPLLPFGLYIVADGMGGHHAGHEASRRASHQVARLVLERIYSTQLKSTAAHAGSPQPVSEVMLEAVEQANNLIHNPEPGKDSGSTLTAVLIFGKRLYVAHVGDSRAYVFSNGILNQITSDHSYVRRLQDAGQITDLEAAQHPQRNMLYQAVGQGDHLEIDTFTQSLPQSGMIVVCSDGLWGLVPDAAIQASLEKEGPITQKVDELVEQALQAGGHDNISLIIVRFDF